MRALFLAISMICGTCHAAAIWNTSFVYYSIDRRAPKFAKLVIRKAATEWSNIGVITLIETERENEAIAQIKIHWISRRGIFEFATNEHGFPAYAQAKGKLGDDGFLSAVDLYINAFDYRYPNPELSVYSSVSHELGHALGLWVHSNDDGDLMYKSQIQGPRTNDIARLKKLYSADR